MDGRIEIVYDSAAANRLDAISSAPPVNPAPHRSPFTVRASRAVFLVLITVLILRAVFVEPFGVPTGSMAPTILGVHRDVNCPNCGYPVRVGEPPEPAPRRFFDVACGNCGAKNLGLESVRPAPGDRLLVDKSAFDWRSARRWEIVVFRTPYEPDLPYIKRIVGLPSETIRISNGDIEVNGSLVRKSMTQTRAVAVPVYCMSSRPSEGWDGRWQVEGIGPPESAPRVEGVTLQFAEFAEWQALVFKALHDEPIGDALPFNGRRNDIPIDWVHDFVVSCDLVVGSSSGEIAVSLNDGADEATLSISRSQGATLEVCGQRRQSAAVRARSGTSYRLEFAFVDRRANVRWDGAAILEPIDLPPAEFREGVTRPLKIATRNLSAVIRNLRLDRDLHYTAAGRLGSGQCRLGPDEYFMLGDNSGNSEDSRFWPNPSIQADALIGKPVFVYAPRRWSTWSALGRTWDVQAIDERRFGWIR
jgi:signal peptidase I